MFFVLKLSIAQLTLRIIQIVYSQIITLFFQFPPICFPGKTGVPGVLKRQMNQHSSFTSYLQDLKTRSDTLMETPVKRLKVGEQLTTAAAVV